MNDPNEAGHESWDVYRKLVLHELGDIADVLERIENRLNELEQGVTALKIKAGVWGLIAGAIPSVTVIIILLLEKVL